MRKVAGGADGGLRVAMLEDVPLFRDAVRRAVEGSSRLTVCSVAGTCHEALALFPRSRPDVALLDLMLPDGSGFDVGVALRGLVPSVRIMLLSEHVQPRILWALPAGERPYWSYLLKSGITSADALCAAINSVMAAPRVDTAVRDIPVPEEHLKLDLLTDRQREILSLVAAGLSNSAIAHRLFTSTKTVEYHLTQIYALLQVSTGASVNSRVQIATLYRSALIAD